MLQLILGFVLGAVVATVCWTSGLAQRFFDYTSAYQYTGDTTAPTNAPAYSAPDNGYQAPAEQYQAPYQAPAGGYAGAGTGYQNGAPLNVSVVPAPASPGGDNFCSAYALTNRTNQAIVMSYADAQGGYDTASGLLVQPGETKVHTIAAAEGSAGAATCATIEVKN